MLTSLKEKQVDSTCQQITNPASVLLLFIFLCLNSFFTAVLVTVATGGRRPSVIANVGHNKLLSQLHYKVVYKMRTGRPKSLFISQFSGRR